jgi:spore maturation protein CgeB
MPEERRRAIAENARKRVLADHTSEHRAQQLETYYLEASAQRHLKSKRLPEIRPVQVAEL